MSAERWTHQADTFAEALTWINNGLGDARIESRTCHNCEARAMYRMELAMVATTSLGPTPTYPIRVVAPGSPSPRSVRDFAEREIEIREHTPHTVWHVSGLLIDQRTMGGLALVLYTALGNGAPNRAGFLRLWDELVDVFTDYAYERWSE